VACGDNGAGRCDLPALTGGLAYTHVTAGDAHTVLIRSDGSAVACGGNRFCQCNLPALEDDRFYVQAAAGGSHTVLLRSDGSAVACGSNDAGEGDIPQLKYMAPSLRTLLLQALFDGVSVRFLTLGGEERCRFWAAPGTLLADVRDWLAADSRGGRLCPGPVRVDAVLPEGRLLSEAAAGDTVEGTFGPAGRSRS